MLINYMPIQTVPTITPTEVVLTRVTISSTGVLEDGGSGQSTDVDTDFSLPLQAKVVDNNGDPIPNVRVDFSAPASGASATFPNADNGLTDANGVVTVTVKANSTSGTYNVEANINPASVMSATFVLTNLLTTAPPVTPTLYLPIINKNAP
jgi:hypothetical protein